MSSHHVIMCHKTHDESMKYMGFFQMSKASRKPSPKSLSRENLKRTYVNSLLAAKVLLPATSFPWIQTNQALKFCVQPFNQHLSFASISWIQISQLRIMKHLVESVLHLKPSWNQLLWSAAASQFTWRISQTLRGPWKSMFCECV